MNLGHTTPDLVFLSHHQAEYKLNVKTFMLYTLKVIGSVAVLKDTLCLLLLIM
jgi:hypothetical protein